MNKKYLIKLIREEYSKRLLELEIAAKIAEAQLVDKRGNILVTKDLKVKHKKSGYEYTVDKIEGEGEDMKIFLRKPGAARIDPPSVMKRMNELDEEILPKKNVGAEINITDIEYSDGEKAAGLESQDLEDIFVVTVKEFEKDYIVD